MPLFVALLLFLQIAFGDCFVLGDSCISDWFRLVARGIMALPEDPTKQAHDRQAVKTEPFSVACHSHIPGERPKIQLSKTKSVPVSTYVFIYMHTCIQLCTYIHLYADTDAYAHIYIYTCVYNIHTYIYIYIYVRLRYRGSCFWGI